MDAADHCISLMAARLTRMVRPCPRWSHPQARAVRPPQGLYDPRAEHDACGVGFVVHMKGTAVARHRGQGAAGPDQPRAPRRLRLRGEHRRRRRHPDPDARRVPARPSCRSRCPTPARYGAGLVFLPHDERDRETVKALIGRIADEEGQRLLGWRDVPTDDSLVGPSARAAEPVLRAGVHRRRAAASLAPTRALRFERKLYVIRKRVEHASTR